MKVQLDYRATPVTIAEFVAAAKISKFIASRVLVRLVLANVMDIVPMPIQDEYTLNRTMKKFTLVLTFCTTHTFEADAQNKKKQDPGSCPNNGGV